MKELKSCREIWNRVPASTCLTPVRLLPSKDVTGWRIESVCECIHLRLEHSLNMQTLLAYEYVWLRSHKQRKGRATHTHTDTYSPKCPAKDIGYHVRDEGEPCDALNKFDNKKKIIILKMANGTLALALLTSIPRTAICARGRRGIHPGLSTLQMDTRKRNQFHQ